MNQRQIGYLVALADHGTLTRAGQVLNVSQPALSRGIRELEASLGVPLTRPRGRELELTEAGVLAVEAGRRALSAFSAVRRAVTARADDQLVRVAATQSMAPIFAERLGAVRRRLPQFNTRLVLAEDQHQAAEMLQSQEADIAFGSINIAPEGLELRSLGSLEVVLISPLGTHLPNCPSFADLLHLPFLCLPVGTEGRRLFDQLFSASNAVPSIIFETEDTNAIIPAVQAGIGSTFVWLPNCLGVTGIERRALNPSWIISVSCLYSHMAHETARNLVYELATDPIESRLEPTPFP